MPTIGTQPSLQSTQLVGAILMHQFARDRFIEAGINEELIKEAEERENIDCLLNSSSIGSVSGSNSTLATDVDASINLNDTSTFSNNTTTLVDDSRVSEIQADVTANPNNQSCGGSVGAQNDTTATGEQFHSMVESVGNTTNNNTVYHSMNAGRSVAANLEKLQMSPTMKYYGCQLRLLAEEFEKDRKRLVVKEHANKVELKDISRENFVKLLEELFRDRITREKIVVLFFFCTDVALRAASFAQELVVKLMGWSFSYIINTVCRVVHELGGWDHLLFRQLPSLLVTCFAALGICALAIYLRKSLRA